MITYCVKSNNIGVFPTTGRPKKDPWGRLTTEYNLTSLINTLLNVDGFVITDPGGYTSIDGNNYIVSNDAGSNSITKGRFQFNIKGYIFTIFGVEALIAQFSNEDAVYANLKIRIEEGSSITQTALNNDNKLVYRMQSIDGNDVKVDDGINDAYYDYQGVTFTNTNMGNEYISLKILEKRDNGWYIPDESKIKFKTNKSGSQRSITIDDGELT